jgi:hypothetical protein
VAVDGRLDVKKKKRANIGNISSRGIASDVQMWSHGTARWRGNYARLMKHTRHPLRGPHPVNRVARAHSRKIRLDQA